MDLVYAEIKLISSDDLALAKKHVIGEDEIKQMHITAFVGTRRYMLAINETIRE